MSAAGNPPASHASWIDFYYRPFRLPTSIDPKMPPEDFVMWMTHSVWQELYKDRPEEWLGLVIKDYLHWLRHLADKSKSDTRRHRAGIILREIHDNLVSGCANPAKKSAIASKHLLVGWLHRYIEYYRSKAYLAPDEYRWRKEAGLLDWQVEAMISLPDLTPESEPLEKWARMGKLLLEMAANNRPLEHPAFCKGGIFADLGNHDGRGEVRLGTRLREGWKALAKTLTMQKKQSESAPNGDFDPESLV